MQPQQSDVTQLLHEWRNGSRDAENRLFEIVLPDLHRMAERFMRRERPDHTLQATELVDHIYLKLVAAKDRDWQNRGHFFAIAARAMRRFLIDYARCRPDADFVPVDALREIFQDRTKVDLAVLVDTLLDEMAKEHPEWCSVVELKFFLGLTDEESAEVMGMKLRTTQRLWQDARRWLFQKIETSP